MIWLVGVWVVVEIGLVVAVVVCVARRSNILIADRTHRLSTETSPNATMISIPVLGPRQLMARAEGEDVGTDVPVPVAAVSVLVVTEGMSDDAPFMF